MGLNCSQCYSTNLSHHCLTEIEVDPDIAGIGVLVAFFLAALVTCMAIFVGYLSDSLPRSVLSSVDEAAICFYRKTFIARRFIPRIARFWMSLKSLLYRCACRDPPQPQPALTQERRVEATTRFLLGFSDQQLVTGLAILIAALVNRFQLTLYELRIAFCLAWFSATTHIATLRILREYFYDHAVVRNWRVLGIFIFTALISFFQVILLLAGDSHTTDGVNYGKPIQCIISGDSRVQNLDFFNALNRVYLIVYLLVLYVPPTLALFEDPRKVPQPSFGSRKLSTLRSETQPGQLSKNALVALCQNAELQHRIVTESHIAAGSPRISNRLGQYRNSFLSSLPTITFSITFGIAQTIFVTWINSPETTEDVRRMGFGQVVAIALLAIPFLTGAEIYNEATKVPANKDDPQTEGHGNDMETFQHLDPELALSEYEERQRSLETDEPAHETRNLHQMISRELSKQVGIGGLSPFRRHLIVYSSLRYTLDRQRKFPRATNHSRKCQYISKLQIGLNFMIDLFVYIFGGIIINIKPVGHLAGVGSGLLAALATWKVLQPLNDHLYIGREVTKFHLDYLKSNKDWLEKHHGYLMEDEDRLLFPPDEQPEKDKKISDGPNEMHVELPKRQDTEADIAIVRRRATD